MKNLDKTDVYENVAIIAFMDTQHWDMQIINVSTYSWMKTIPTMNRLEDVVVETYLN